MGRALCAERVPMLKIAGNAGILATHVYYGDLDVCFQLLVYFRALTSDLLGIKFELCGHSACISLSGSHLRYDICNTNRKWIYMSGLNTHIIQGFNEI